MVILQPNPFCKRSHYYLNRNMINQSSYQWRKNGLAIEADDRRSMGRFLVSPLTFPQMGEPMLHKLVVVLHRVASGYGSRSTLMLNFLRTK